MSDLDHNKAFATNKDTWNKKVAVHAASEFYDLEGFKKGATSLNTYELHALGDVKGKSLLHLQCHFGMDTLSWSRKGARAVGVDISDAAIELARSLNQELDLDARFVCCNVLDTSQHLDQQFDIVFTSYGTIGWLPDLRPWANMIAQRLKPGGVFYIVEFHPIVWMFDYQQDPPKMIYGYDQAEAIYEEYEGTYAQNERGSMTSKEYGWNHGLSEVIGALMEAGLQVDHFKELHASPYDVLPGLVKGSDGLYRRPDGLYPLLFELKCKK